ncbi:hypothetical protein P692DRAFT_20217937 [Suillus brevipes Sb2]|nr:hypothetical protein P692DRAFT_20217937 [Suillus brevipes Sb2]
MPQDGPCSIRSIEGVVTPRACPAKPKRVHILVSITPRLDLCEIDFFQNFSIYASLQREHLKIALEISC